MIRKSFLQTLDKKLKKFDNREREEAILFYSELFDEMNLADEDQIPNQYDVNKIARELNVSMKIDNWEDENSSIKKIFKGIPIITLSILSLPTILVGLIVFLALLFTAIFLIAATYFTIILFVIGTVKNFFLGGFSIASLFLLLGVILLVISATGILIEIINLIGKLIIKRIKERNINS